MYHIKIYKTQIVLPFIGWEVRNNLHINLEQHRLKRLIFGIEIGSSKSQSITIKKSICLTQSYFRPDFINKPTSKFAIKFTHLVILCSSTPTSQLIACVNMWWDLQQRGRCSVNTFQLVPFAQIYYIAFMVLLGCFPVLFSAWSEILL